MNDYLQFYRENIDIVNVLTIYTLEAHWVEDDLDGWPIGHSYRFPRHKTIGERIKMANKFIDDFNWDIPTVVDSMDDEFNNIYASWPDRAYVVYEGKLVYISMIPEDGTREYSWIREINSLLLN